MENAATLRPFLFMLLLIEKILVREKGKK